MVQELKPIGDPMRFRFSNWDGGLRTDDANFGKKIIFSDEAHFDFGGYENKKNCWIWRTEIRRTQNESLFAADFGPEA